MFGKPKKGFYTVSSRWRGILEDLLSCNAEFLQRGMQRKEFVESWLSIYRPHRNVRDCGFRQVFPDLIASEVCKNTRILDNLDGVNLEGVFPAFVINVPRGTEIASEETGNLTHVVVDVSDRTVIPAGIPTELVSTALNHVERVYSFLFYFENIPPKGFAFAKNSGRLTNENGDFVFDQARILGGTYDVQSELIGVAVGWTINMILLMSAYPQYRQATTGNVSFCNRKQTTQEYHVSIGKEIPIDRTVVDRCQDRHAYQATGRKMPTHWKLGYWKRQPHGSSWSPKDGIFPKMGSFEDGRSWHLILIPPTLVNKQVGHQ